MTASDSTHNAQIDVRHYVRVVLRRKYVVLAVAALVVLAALAYLSRTPLSYTGRSTVIIKVITSTPFEANVRPDLLVVPATETAIATSTAVASRAAALMGKRGEERLVRRSVSVSVPPKSQVLTIEYKAPSAEEAAAGANAFAAAYLEHRATQALEERDKAVAEMTDNVNRLRDELSRTNATISAQEKGTAAYEDSVADRDVLRLQIANVRDRQSILATMPTDGGEIVTEAAVPAGPSAPNRSQLLAAALLIGIVFGVLVAFIRDRLDSAIRDAPELEEASGLPLLATIPGVPAWARDGTLAVVERPYGATAEAYRRCRAAITAIHEQAGDGKHILVIDTAGSNAAGEVAANLAVSMQRGGHRVVLVIAEAGHDSLYTALGVRRSAGLSEVLNGSVALTKALQGKGLRVLTAGVGEAALPDLVTGGRLSDLLNELTESFDYVVVGAPSITMRFGTVVELARSGRALLVAERGHASRERIRALVAELALFGAHWEGCLMRGRASSQRWRFPNVFWRRAVPVSPERPAPLREAGTAPAEAGEAALAERKPASTRPPDDARRSEAGIRLGKV